MGARDWPVEVGPRLYGVGANNQVDRVGGVSPPRQKRDKRTPPQKIASSFAHLAAVVISSRI